ncbi:hypothetical protein ASF61_20490 [Duganella sp. Leaf126]|uniref:general secretion pathway protein GspB n=1 Tax=Duganella sp. Leaf126 TaxID=1736266 RepID=UPI0006F89584|nr:general secretion pathway protein GspB [Duganella sp. Leaf126]KQQ45336.1 hypothetical protein ASF61_20490 [Duganella sp. Leaf126]
MSYILEALKKAQAERQLGNSPTIHAPSLQAGAEAAASGRLKTPLVLALAAMAVAIVVLLVLVLRPAGTVAPVPPTTSAVPAPSEPVTTPATARTSAAAQSPSAALAAPVAALPPPVAVVTTPLTQPSPSPSPASAATVAPPAAGKVEEPVLNLRELPEPIQRAIPQVAVGGYIYSKNPADRLLLVDKILRHEGEEVAPGLLLEKLHPKEAVFSYKGYRYRVPY